VVRVTFEEGCFVLEIAPVSFAQAKEFIRAHHRHHKPPTGWKFGVGVTVDGKLVGVGTAGRPIARHFDDGRTLEVNRTCTDGSRNANSIIYGSLWRAAKALGYLRMITYTQADETGASLRAAGWIRVREIPARGSWAESSVKVKHLKDPIGSGGIARTLWEIRRFSNEGAS